MSTGTFQPEERSLIHGFWTRHESRAIAALLVYGIYRSRDQGRFKVTPDMWGRIERAVKSCALSAQDLEEFIDRFKSKMQCSTIHPRYMRSDLGVGQTLVEDRRTGEILGTSGDRREFWVEILEDADHKAALDALYRQTGAVVALVRDRLEREKPLEALIGEETRNDGDTDNKAE